MATAPNLAPPTTTSYGQTGISGQALLQTSPTNLDPPGLAVTSGELRQIWNQIQFPMNWTLEDSVKLLTIFESAKSRPPGSSQRYWPQQGMDIISKHHVNKADSNYCLERYLRRQKKPKWDKNTDASQSLWETCNESSGLCVDVWHINANPGDYDFTTSKRWRLVKKE